MNLRDLIEASPEEKQGAFLEEAARRVESGEDPREVTRDYCEVVSAIAGALSGLDEKDSKTK